MSAAPAYGGSLSWSDDLDEICGYLTMVKGFIGAAIFSVEGLPIAWGASSTETYATGAPLLVQMLLDHAEFAERHGLGPAESLLSEDAEHFWFCGRVHDKIYVVAGTRGSYELFKGRIERCMQMAGQVLRDRRLVEGP